MGTFSRIPTAAASETVHTVWVWPSVVGIAFAAQKGKAPSFLVHKDMCIIMQYAQARMPVYISIS